MENIQVFDKTFSLSKITAYSLALEIDYKHIAYTIIDNIRKHFIALVYKKFEEQVNEQNFLDIVDKYIKNDQYLQKHYKEVNFIFPSNKFILVPKNYFDKDNIKLYFQAGNELEHGEEIQFNYIPEVETYLVFAISSDITNFFVYRFPEINFYHQGIPIIRKYSQFSKNYDKTIAAINIRQDLLMDILVTEKGKLLYYNIFNYTDDDTAIFNILNVLNNFGYDARVELMGDIDKNSPLLNVLEKYLTDLNFAQIQQEYKAEFSNKIDTHRFTNIFYLPD